MHVIPLDYVTGQQFLLPQAPPSACLRVHRGVSKWDDRGQKRCNLPLSSHIVKKRVGYPWSTSPRRHHSQMLYSLQLGPSDAAHPWAPGTIQRNPIINTCFCKLVSRSVTIGFHAEALAWPQQGPLLHIGEPEHARRSPTAASFPQSQFAIYKEILKVQI